MADRDWRPPALALLRRAGGSGWSLLPSSHPEGLAIRVLVCGGRKFFDNGAVDRALSRLHAKVGITAIIQGGADGADRLAAEWGWDHGIPVATFNADWKAHPRAAGVLRNARMIAEGKPDGVVAFPGERGTADMIRRAEEAGLKVWQPCQS